MMNGVTKLGYLGIASNKLSEWESFGTGILGLQLARKEAGTLVFRMDDYEQRIIVVQGDAEDLAFSGWEAATPEDLGYAVSRLKQAGVAVRDGTPEETAERRVAKLYICHDPDGNQAELYFGPTVTNAPFRSPILRSSFVTGEQGLGHYFMISKHDRQKTLDFYVGLLGFRVSDYIRQEMAPGIVADAAFLHCNGRHHTLAAAVIPPIAKRIHHIMIEVADMSDVGAAYDRVLAQNVPLELTLGMHPNDKMFSFYVRTPSGFAIEFGWGGLVVDDAVWTVKTFDHLSEWGHKPAAARAA